MPKDYTLTRTTTHWLGQFSAMASPCEVLIATDNQKMAEHIAALACNEARRIEQKFSRYRDDNITYKINNANGRKIKVDDETANMLDFADQCYQLSDGKFDITSGVLRAIWKFDGSDNIPTQQQIDAIKIKIGWDKVIWQRPYLTLQPGMEIDLGGLGKEYAVDHTALLIKPILETGVLVNYGGDIFSHGTKDKNQPWRIGIDDTHATGKKARGQVELNKGGLATSGDARRFLIKDHVRYSHILNPLTGWPVPDAPRSVTVIASTCLDAGMLSTFAMLEGKNADAFLKAQGVQYYCQY
ncbi:MAG: FAD:protein FMN transferase [Gammaproteobacteria bacterium]|nr:FAD:protein FMN transferase [Gammaproteobacteria bacterium]MDH5735661.1 FAD:protein FMN transferase [Gammaproteobacteria bacterium]